MADEPFDPYHSPTDTTERQRIKWKGLLFYFKYPLYWLKVILYGKSALVAPEPFQNTLKVGHHIAHGGFFFKLSVKKFFYGTSVSKDLNLLDKVSLLLDVGDSDEIIQKCKEFVNLHRIHENTKARRRLEKWASRVIVLYLLIVLCLVVFNYIKTTAWKFMNIENTVMITILSTTTVNIIGLGLIILRGHFLNKDNSNEFRDSKKKSQLNSSNAAAKEET